MEESVFQILGETGTDSAGIKAIQDIYYLKMKPLITEDEIRYLKIRYEIKEKRKKVTIQVGC